MTDFLPKQHQSLIRIALFGTLILYVFSLWQRAPHIDGAWLAEHAYWLSELGYVKSDLMWGITQQEERLLLHHKLFTFIGSKTIQYFGISLQPLKCISLVSFGVFTLLFYRYTVIKKQLFTNIEFIFALFLLLSHKHVFEYSFVYRPELLLMLFGFISFLFLEKSNVEEGKNSSFSALLAGIFAGLCLLTHLNGSMFIGAGFFLFILEKKWKQASLFAIASLTISSLYFWDFTKVYGLDFWRMQLQNNPFHSLPLGWQILQNIVDEQMRFFMSHYEFSFSLIFIFALLIGWPYLKEKHKRLLQFTALLMFFLGAFSLAKTTKYALPYFPYIIMLIVLGLKGGFAFITEKKGEKRKGPLPNLSEKTLKTTLSVLIFCFFCLHSWHNWQIATHKFNVENNTLLSSQYLPEPQSKLKIIAPMDFVFNGLGNFNRLQGELSYVERQAYDSSIRGAGFFKKAAEDEVDYILLSDVFLDDLELEAPVLKDSIEPYTLTGMDDFVRVFKKKGVIPAVEKSK